MQYRVSYGISYGVRNAMWDAMWIAICNMAGQTAGDTKKMVVSRSGMKYGGEIGDALCNTGCNMEGDVGCNMQHGV